MYNCLILLSLCTISAIVDGQVDDTDFDFDNLGFGGSILPLAQDYCILDVPNTENMQILHESNNNELLENDSEIKELETIKYTCNRKYYVNGADTNLCSPGGNWKNPHPTCTRYCDRENILHFSFITNCKYNNTIMDCEKDYLPVGTTAEIRCKIWYVPEKGLQAKQTLTCTENGWSAETKPCYPTCGLRAPPLYGFDKEKIPWHATIYYSRDNQKFIWFCSATIIDEKTLISPAHCFWNGKRLNIRYKHFKHFRVIIGKSFSDYDTKEYIDTQSFNVTGIYVPKNFVYSRPRYENDIAIIMLDKVIEFNLFIKPICLEWFNKDNKTISTGIKGQMPVRSEDTAFNQEVIEFSKYNMSTIDHTNCSGIVQDKYKFNLSNDKFCVLIPSTHNGTRGGAFITSKEKFGQEEFYLYGMPCLYFSRGISNGNILLAFTNIQIYEDEIKFFLNKQRQSLV